MLTAKADFRGNRLDYKYLGKENEESRSLALCPWAGSGPNPVSASSQRA